MQSSQSSLLRCWEGVRMIWKQCCNHCLGFGDLQLKIQVFQIQLFLRTQADYARFTQHPVASGLCCTIQSLNLHNWSWVLQKNFNTCIWKCVQKQVLSMFCRLEHFKIWLHSQNVFWLCSYKMGLDVVWETWIFVQGLYIRQTTYSQFF